MSSNQGNIDSHFFNSMKHQLITRGSCPEEWLDFVDTVARSAKSPDHIDRAVTIFEDAIEAVEKAGNTNVEAYARLYINYAKFVSKESREDARTVLTLATHKARMFAIVYIVYAQLEVDMGDTYKANKILSKARAAGAQPADLLDIATEALKNGHAELVTPEQFAQYEGVVPVSTPTASRGSIESGSDVSSSISPPTLYNSVVVTAVGSTTASPSQMMQALSLASSSAASHRAATSAAATQRTVTATTAARKTSLATISPAAPVGSGSTFGRTLISSVATSTKPSVVATYTDGSSHTFDTAPHIVDTQNKKSPIDRAQAESHQVDSSDSRFYTPQPLRATRSTPDLRSAQFVRRKRPSHTSSTVRSSLPEITKHTAQSQSHVAMTTSDDSYKLCTLPEEKEHTQRDTEKEISPALAKQHKPARLSSYGRVLISSLECAAYANEYDTNLYTSDQVKEPSGQHGVLEPHTQPTTDDAPHQPNLPRYSEQYHQQQQSHQRQQMHQQQQLHQQQPHQQQLFRKSSQVPQSYTSDQQTPMEVQYSKNKPDPAVTREEKHQGHKEVRFAVTQDESCQTADKCVMAEEKQQASNASNTCNKRSNILKVNGNVYHLLRKIGVGGFSSVYEAHTDSAKPEPRAIKCLNLENADDNTLKGYQQEIELLERLKDCPYVIDIYEYEYSRSKQQLFIVMEKGDLDLTTLLKTMRSTHKNAMPLVIRTHWLCMLHAVNALHQRGIIHSDLKPANFVLVHGSLKLIDFGIARAIQVDHTSVTLHDVVGTINYMAPENLQTVSQDSTASHQEHIATKKKINTKSDVWSLGCILYAMMYGHAPFGKLDMMAKIQVLSGAHYTIPYADPERHTLAIDLIERCLIRDPTKRPTVDELLYHPYTTSDLSALDLLVDYNVVNVITVNDMRQKFLKRLKETPLQLFLPNKENIPHKPTVETDKIRSNISRARVGNVGEQLSSEKPPSNYSDAGSRPPLHQLYKD